MIDNILTALAATSATALVLGILLALVSRFFGIKENKDAKRIRDALPGVNCGTCGYRGCDDYAVAIAEGNAAPNLCIPGGNETAEVIGDILGIEVEPPKDVVAFIHCNGGRDATGDKMRYEGISTCHAATLIFGGPKACHYGCIGFGDCALACPADAICIKNKIAHVDVSSCMGCGLCADSCPNKLISMLPKKASVVVMCNSKDKGAVAKKTCKNACIGCKKCEKACPCGAIKVVNNLAVIDYDKCSGCGACADACPTKCLKHTAFSEKNV